MADVTITAANVTPVAGAQIGRATAGVAIAAGKAIRLDASGLMQLAKADSPSTAHVDGISVNGGSAGQPVDYIESGSLLAGGTLVKAGVYVLSAATAGGIAPLADLATTNQLTILGYASTSGQLEFNPNSTGVALP